MTPANGLHPGGGADAAPVPRATRSLRLRRPRLPRLRHLPKSAWKFAVFALACLVLLVGLAVHVGDISLFTPRHTIYAQLSDATGLTPGTPVDVAGVQVGQVSSVAVQRGHALVGLSIDNDVALRRGTDVGLRWKNVIGQKDVYLYPSSRGPLIAAGQTIPLRNDVTDASVNSFLNSLGPLLQAINPREANAFVVNVSAALDGDTAEIDQLLASGARISSTVGALNVQVGQVIDSLDQVMTAIAQRSSDVGTLVANLDTVARALSSHNTLLDTLVGNLSTVAGDMATLLGQNRSTLSATIADLNTATATIDAHQAQLAQSLSSLGSGLAPYVEISSYGQWFQVQTIYNCLANQSFCSYDAPTTPPAGSGPGGAPPPGTPLSGIGGSGGGGTGTASTGAASSAGGTGTGGTSSVPAILHTVAGGSGGGG
ncbi:MAG TPA: MCE family protein [Acidimicrobiales bacterium]|nr:MCE family protein [Acidimicrobiales bacterium]